MRLLDRPIVLGRICQIWQASRPSHRRIRSFFFRIGLALALVAGQQAGGLHELSHGLAELAQKSGTPEPIDHVCEKCLAFASLGHIVSSVAILLVSPFLSFPEPSQAQASDPQTLRVLAYRSRAPPVLS